MNSSPPPRFSASTMSLMPSTRWATETSRHFSRRAQADALRAIRFTDELLALASDADVKQPLEAETESRWRLVESTWHEKRSTGSMLRVVYDRPSKMIVRGMLGHRRSITWVRPGLSGYQSSACFYCGAPVTPLLDLEHSADVDHYFPHMLIARGVFLDLDDVWNLVLACAVCNRGPAGQVPSPSPRRLPRAALAAQRAADLQSPSTARSGHRGHGENSGGAARLRALGPDPRDRACPSGLETPTLTGGKLVRDLIPSIIRESGRPAKSVRRAEPRDQSVSTELHFARAAAA